jgi:hypothetical protein
MTTTLNASTSSGFVMTPDNSGVIALQNNGTTGLTVNSSGYVLTPTRPCFNYSAANLGTTVSAGNYVKFGTVYSNQGSNYSTSTGLFTAPIAGLYYFVFNLYPNGATTGTVRLALNGIDSSASGPLVQLIGNASYPTYTLAEAITLGVNDTIGVYVHSNSIYADGDCRFSGFLVG